MRCVCLFFLDCCAVLKADCLLGRRSGEARGCCCCCCASSRSSVAVHRQQRLSQHLAVEDGAAGETATIFFRVFSRRLWNEFLVVLNIILFIYSNPSNLLPSAFFKHHSGCQANTTPPSPPHSFPSFKNCIFSALLLAATWQPPQLLTHCAVCSALTWKRRYSRARGCCIGFIAPGVIRHQLMPLNGSPWTRFKGRCMVEN